MFYGYVSNPNGGKRSERIASHSPTKHVKMCAVTFTAFMFKQKGLAHVYLLFSQSFN